mgnify:CR=1 FL=1
MIVNRFLTACLLSAVLISASGCGGGTPVADQERFKAAMNKPADVAAADQWRSTISGLKSAVVTGEAGADRYELESVMEDSDSMNIMKLPEEHRATASEIMDKMEELKTTKSKNDKKKLIEEMEELADKLPK